MVRNTRILHVDDDPSFAELVATYLERERDAFEVVTETSPQDAIHRVETEFIDCIVSDFDMPGMDGLELLAGVRERYPDLPYVLFTGKGTEEVASEAISMGVTDYLQKETTTDQYTVLANRLENAIEQREHERQLKTLISNLPGMAYQCRLSPSWPMEFVNGEVEALSGYTKAALESGDVSWGEDVLHPEDRDDVWREVRSEIRTDGSFEITYRILTKGGEERWVWERGRRISGPDEEEPLLEGFATDITRRMEVKRQLKRERQFTEQSLDALTDVYYVFDAEGRFLGWNDRLTEVTGYTDEEIAEMRPTDFFARDQRAGIEAAITEVFETGNARLEAEVVTKHEDRIPYEFTGSLLTDEDGAPLGFVGVGREIDE